MEADDEYLTGLSNKGTLNRGRKGFAGSSPLRTGAGRGAAGDARRGDVHAASPAWGQRMHLSGPRRLPPPRQRHPLGEGAARAGGRAFHRRKPRRAVRCGRKLRPIRRIGSPGAGSTRRKGRTSARVSARFHAAARLPVRGAAARDGGEASQPPCPRGCRRRDCLPWRRAPVTVRLPWEPAVVRLLIPPEHSSRSLPQPRALPSQGRGHLLYQIAKGRLEPGELTAQEEEVWDAQALRGVTDAVCGAVAAQLRTGVSRLPPSAEGSMERLAAMAHSARLPELERSLQNRRLHARPLFFPQRRLPG
ncbi:MAG: hypothetical protein ACLU9S_21545 [Oscillospiraceae bacterium]